MNPKSTGRHSIAMILSVVIHMGIAMMLLGLPKHIKTMWDTVDVEMFESEPVPKPEPEPEPEPEPVPVHEPKPAPPPKKKQPPQKNKEPEPVPEPEPELEPDVPQEPPPKAEEAPPVFDLGDNTFAQDGRGNGWSLNRSEGNTKFASVQKGTKSVRGTSPKQGETHSVAANPKTGFTPVPSKDWSQKPEPVDSGNSMPEYPFEAKRDGIEGKVRLQVFIGKDGIVKKVRVISDPGKGLGESSKKHALKKKWRPALDKNGNPVDTIIVWTYTFILDS